MTNVQLALLPTKRPTRIVVGTSVRKPAVVLQHYLAALAAQELPPGAVLVPIFVADQLAPDAAALPPALVPEPPPHSPPPAPPPPAPAPPQ